MDYYNLVFTLKLNKSNILSVSLQILICKAYFCGALLSSNMLRRPEEFKALIEAEKNNIYSNALDLLYQNPEMTQYLPKKSAQDIFFSKKGKYSENRKYLYPEEKVETEKVEPMSSDETQDIDWDEFLKQK